MYKKYLIIYIKKIKYIFNTSHVHTQTLFFLVDRLEYIEQKQSYILAT